MQLGEGGGRFVQGKGPTDCDLIAAAASRHSAATVFFFFAQTLEGLLHWQAAAALMNRQSARPRDAESPRTRGSTPTTGPDGGLQRLPEYLDGNGSPPSTSTRGRRDCEMRERPRDQDHLVRPAAQFVCKMIARARGKRIPVHLKCDPTCQISGSSFAPWTCAPAQGPLLSFLHSGGRAAEGSIWG